MKLSRFALLSLFALTSSPVWADGVVTVYSADGLHDGDNSWYQSQFAAFTKATGIKVQYVEGGFRRDRRASGEGAHQSTG